MSCEQLTMHSDWELVIRGIRNWGLDSANL